MGTVWVPIENTTNKHNQIWDAPNVFVTDGSFMTSVPVNPSLTYMAFTARHSIAVED